MHHRQSTSTRCAARSGNDKRFVLIENERQVGFYLNFERALQHVPASVPYVALSDQDDVWHPAKLRRQCDVLDNDRATQLVASDARVVDASGRVIAPTFYARRRPTHANPYSLFVVNSLIGASMLFRRELLALALPFPRAFPNKFHDHWLARSALIAGTVGFVDEPLHDYIQHGDNTFGSRQSVQWPLGPAMKVILRRVIGVAELPPDWERYFVDTPLEASVAAKLLEGEVAGRHSGPLARPGNRAGRWPTARALARRSRLRSRTLRPAHTSRIRGVRPGHWGRVAARTPASRGPS